MRAMQRLLLALVLVVSSAATSRAANAAGSAGPTRVDLSAIRQQVLRYLESLQMPGKPCGCLKDPKAAAALLYPSCDAAITRTVMGEDLQRRRSRSSWSGSRTRTSCSAQSARLACCSNFCRSFTTTR